MTDAMSPAVPGPAAQGDLGVDRARSVAIVPAGERWGQDGSLRPALEDHLGAGAILSALERLGHGARMSPEALAAVDLFDAGRGHLVERMRSCTSGRGLAGIGFGSDVDVAAALDASRIVPVLRDGSFGPAGGLGRSTP